MPISSELARKFLQRSIDTLTKEQLEALLAQSSATQHLLVADPVLQLLGRVIDTLDSELVEELYDYVDEALWDRQFEQFPAALVELENKITAADHAGLTSELDFEQYAIQMA